MKKSLNRFLKIGCLAGLLTAANIGCDMDVGISFVSVGAMFD